MACTAHSRSNWECFTIASRTLHILHVTILSICRCIICLSRCGEGRERQHVVSRKCHYLDRFGPLSKPMPSECSRLFLTAHVDHGISRRRNIQEWTYFQTKRSMRNTYSNSQIDCFPDGNLDEGSRLCGFTIICNGFANILEMQLDEIMDHS